MKGKSKLTISFLALSSVCATVLIVGRVGCEASTRRPQSRILPLDAARVILFDPTSSRQDRLDAAKMYWRVIERTSDMMKRATAGDPQLRARLQNWHNHLSKDFKSDK